MSFVPMKRWIGCGISSLSMGSFTTTALGFLSVSAPAVTASTHNWPQKQSSCGKHTKSTNLSNPLHREDRTISKPDAYDAASGMFCYDVPDLTGMVPEQPTQAEAEAALRLLR